MRRVLPVLLPLLLVAGCEGGESPSPGAPSPGPTAQVRASFPRGGIADTIAVNAIERLPLRAADLVAPDGTITPASNIDVAASPRFATGLRTLGNPWQNALSGNSALGALAMPNAQGGAALQGQGQLLATVSSAEIALPDPVVYRRDWQHYRIRLTFGTPPAVVETRELAAPEPPPEASPGS